MKALTASTTTNILCSHRLNISNNNHQFSPLSIRRRSSSSNDEDQDQLVLRSRSCLKLRLVVARAADSPPSVPASAGAGAGSGGKAIVEDDEFSLAKVSFGVIGLGLGVSLLSYGFGAYFNILPGSEWSALMLTYGFPLSIIGMALKYAELKPVPCLTYSDAQALREKCATPILKQVRNDVIRFRYGDEQHLDEALKRIFQYGLGSGVARRNAPVLKKIREEVTEDGKYCLVLVFEAKALELADFEKRQQKFATFFGPGITAEVGTGEEQNMYDVRLISDTTL
ncbi:acclimation of photosynthesis to environment [Artemisia annua]|uniref:Acclimation of photosynthesis to environment n=1 Tax=Artemisia annua TaxID=35608 RepID=A0A2U1N5M7_ARTAN|nr:acclimation of photosynthesis to environment [Artemisia annua]